MFIYIYIYKYIYIFISSFPQRTRLARFAKVTVKWVYMMELP